MNIQLIRHATLKIRLNHLHFIVDPMLSRKERLDPVANAANNLRNPRVDLPLTIDQILTDIDAVLLTHSHRDHFDDQAIELIPKNVPIFCQPQDEQKLLTIGFTNVIKVNNQVLWNGILIRRTGGEHGTGELGKQMGPVSGFILSVENEPSIYISGDTIWCKDVQDALSEQSPDVIVLNGGAAQYLTGDPITMGMKDIEKVSLAAPLSKVMVVHMESWNHCLLSRSELTNYIKENQLNNIAVPVDGESFEISFNS